MFLNDLGNEGEKKECVKRKPKSDPKENILFFMFIKILISKKK